MFPRSYVASPQSPFSAKGRLPVRFGKVDQPASLEQRLLSFGPVIGRLPDFQDPSKQLGQPDFLNGLELLSDTLQERCKKRSERISPSEADTMVMSEMFGPAEEAADMLVEAVDNQAKAKGIITEAKVDKIRREILPPKNQVARQAKPFANFMDELIPMLPPAKTAKLVQSINWNNAWNNRKSNELIRLLFTKAALLNQPGKTGFLMGEAKELNDQLPPGSLRRFQVLALAWLYEHFSLPLSFLYSQLQGVVSSQLPTKVPYPLLLDVAFKKQWLRQEVCYYNPQYTNKVEVKKITKPWEALSEGELLKKAGVL
jgi:hypothetical protein